MNTQFSRIRLGPDYSDYLSVTLSYVSCNHLKEPEIDMFPNCGINFHLQSDTVILWNLSSHVPKDSAIQWILQYATLISLINVVWSFCDNNINIHTRIVGGQWHHKITIYGNGLSVYIHI